MELIDNNDFNTNPNGVSQISSSHLYLNHHQLQVDHHSMNCISTPISHLSSFNHPFTTPSSQLCHKKHEPDQKSGGGRKRRRGSDGGGGGVEGLNLNSSDVIHVRVKRGQATDSHSLAERVRRKKINEKLQSLHDIVPGCHQRMGMAVMLDVVTKYIQSLQNQIEFLSMKLLTTSLLHDPNTPDMDDTMVTVQGPVHRAEVQEMERLVAEGYGGGSPYFNSMLFSHESLQNP